jgi:hypothetical protein
MLTLCTHRPHSLSSSADPSSPLHLLLYLSLGPHHSPFQRVHFSLFIVCLFVCLFTLVLIILSLLFTRFLLKDCFSSFLLSFLRYCTSNSPSWRLCVRKINHGFNCLYDCFLCVPFLNRFSSVVCRILIPFSIILSLATPYDISVNQSNSAV